MTQGNVHLNIILSVMLHVENIYFFIQISQQRLFIISNFVKVIINYTETSIISSLNQWLKKQRQMMMKQGKNSCISVSETQVSLDS